MIRKKVAEQKFNSESNREARSRRGARLDYPHRAVYSNKRWLPWLCAPYANNQSTNLPQLTDENMSKYSKMTSNPSQTSLPLDLILSVIEWIVPDPKSIALPPSHVVTKTLLCLARTSAIAYPAARRLLYTHCLWIDSVQRLQCLVASFQTPPSVLHRTRPEVPVLEHINSLYLFYDEGEVRNLSVALLLLDLFALVAPHLRRLVIDLPLYELYLGIDTSTSFPKQQLREVRSITRSALLKLTAIETVCSTRNEVWAPVDIKTEHDPYIFASWPKLKTVVLNDPDISRTAFWEVMGPLKHLETVVLTGCRGLDVVALSAEWRKACGDEKRPLDIVLVNEERDHRPPFGRSSWKEDGISVRKVIVPEWYCEGEDRYGPCYGPCEEWVKTRMLRGEKPVDWN